MESCNDHLLHPSFVEPLKSEVKKKISVCVADIASRHPASRSRMRSRREPHCELENEAAEKILPRMRHHSWQQILSPSGQ